MKHKIKYLVMDVDGTLTDGKIYMGSDGELMKAFDIKDGYGIHNILIPNGITPVIITGRTSSIVENRCKELGISVLYQGVKNKMEVLSAYLQQKCDDFSTVAFIGDDLNDMSCINEVKKAGGVIGCPANAVKTVKESSTFISRFNGGDGAVREFIEYLINEDSVETSGS